MALWTFLKAFPIIIGGNSEFNVKANQVYNSTFLSEITIIRKQKNHFSEDLVNYELSKIRNSYKNYNIKLKSLQISSSYKVFANKGNHIFRNSPTISVSKEMLSTKDDVNSK